jgi:hypothetical protein
VPNAFPKMTPEYHLNAKLDPEARPSHHKNWKRHQMKAPHAEASALSAFFGVAFLAAAFLGAAFLAAGAGLAAVFATRPDLVLVRTVGLSTTAGAAGA